jgi:hypothetical protein
VEKADATGLFFVVLHEVGLYLGMIFYFEFPKLGSAEKVRNQQDWG